MMAPSPDWITGIKVPLYTLGQLTTCYLLLAAYCLLLTAY